MRQRTQKAAGSPNGGERALIEQPDELARACGTYETRPRTGGVREIGRERVETGTGD